MKTIDESLRIADGYNNNVKVNVAAPEHEAIVCLAAEVRRLQAENERLRRDAERMNGDIADLRQLIARYRERELTMGWNQE